MAVKAGYIYLLIHPSDPRLIKVGMTTRHPEDRLKEHNTQFDKLAGKIVKETGEKWVIKKFFQVEDTYNAESAFWHRSPLAEIPYSMGTEIFRLCEPHLGWDWINEGLELAKQVGIRRDVTQPPIPKQEAKKGAKWIEEQIQGSGLRALDGCGNGITKKAFECSEEHIFKIVGRVLVQFPYCPVCEPERYESWALRRVEYL